MHEHRGPAAAFHTDSRHSRESGLQRAGVAAQVLRASAARDRPGHRAGQAQGLRIQLYPIPFQGVAAGSARCCLCPLPLGKPDPLLRQCPSLLGKSVGRLSTCAARSPGVCRHRSRGVVCPHRLLEAVSPLLWPGSDILELLEDQWAVWSLKDLRTQGSGTGACDP